MSCAVCMFRLAHFLFLMRSCHPRRSLCSAHAHGNQQNREAGMLSEPSVSFTERWFQVPCCLGCPHPSRRLILRPMHCTDSVLQTFSRPIKLRDFLLNRHTRAALGSRLYACSVCLLSCLCLASIISLRSDSTPSHRPHGLGQEERTHHHSVSDIPLCHRLALTLTSVSIIVQAKHGFRSVPTLLASQRHSSSQCDRRGPWAERSYTFATQTIECKFGFASSVGQAESHSSQALN